MQLNVAKKSPDFIHDQGYDHPKERVLKALRGYLEGEVNAGFLMYELEDLMRHFHGYDFLGKQNESILYKLNEEILYFYQPQSPPKDKKRGLTGILFQWFKTKFGEHAYDDPDVRNYVKYALNKLEN